MQLDRPTLYRRVTAIETQVEEKVVQTFNYEKLRDQLTERDLEAMRKLQRAEVNIGALKNGLQQIKSMVFEVRNQIEHKKQHTSELERQIKGYEAQEAEIDTKVKAMET